MSIQRRVRKAEEAVNLDREPIVCGIVWFGGEPVPSEQRQGNVMGRHVAFETIQMQQEERARYER